MMDVEIHLLIASLIVFFLAIILTITQRITISSQIPLPYQLGWKSPKKERRIYLRYKTLLRTKYKTNTEQGISWISDISRGGLRLFLANKTCTIGNPLQVEIDLPHPQKPIFAQGNIVWMEEGEAGLSFSEVARGDVTRVIQYIGEIEQLKAN